MHILTALIAGLIFGLGLIVSGMGDPAKVIGFLDLAGAWDPSLAFVMAGAIALGMVAFRTAARRRTTLLGQPLELPHNTRIDRRLVIGSTLFGIGWGLAGICPGPAFILLGRGIDQGLVFVLAMLAGMAAFAAWQRRKP